MDVPVARRSWFEVLVPIPYRQRSKTDGVLQDKHDLAIDSGASRVCTWCWCERATGATHDERDDE